MNVTEWIRDLPLHVREAWRSLYQGSDGFSLTRFTLWILLALSALATGLGLYDLVEANNAGRVGLVEGFVVFALAAGAVVTMWIALEQAIGAMTWWARVRYALVYVFFLLWSVGFGFGFYWKNMVSIDAAQSRIGETTLSVRKPLDEAEARLNSIRNKIQSVENTSLSAMKTERDGGGGCGRTSAAGGGPLCKARLAMTMAVHGRSTELVGWSGGGKLPDLGQLSCEAAGAPAPRAEFGSTALQKELENLRAEGTRLETQAKTSGADQIEQDFSDYSARARDGIDRVNAILRLGPSKERDVRILAQSMERGYPESAPICRDRDLAVGVRDLADQLKDLAPIEMDIAPLDVGGKATKAAFYRLYDNVFSLPGRFFRWIRGNEAGRAGPAVGAPLTSRDFVALIAAIAVDIAILFLALASHSGSPFRRLNGVLELPLDAAELRERILCIARADPDFLSAFEQSLATYRGRYFLVASTGLRELYTSMRALLVMLQAAGMGQIAQPEGIVASRLRPVQRDRFLAAMQAPLVAAAQRLGRDDADFPPAGMLVLEIPARVVQAINLLICTGEAGPRSPGPGAEAEPPDGGSGDRPSTGEADPPRQWSDPGFDPDRDLGGDPEPGQEPRDDTGGTGEDGEAAGEAEPAPPEPPQDPRRPPPTLGQ